MISMSEVEKKVIFNNKKKKESIQFESPHGDNVEEDDILDTILLCFYGRGRFELAALDPRESELTIESN